VVRPVVNPDVPAQTHRHGMDGPIGIHVRVGQLEPGDHQHPVVALRPLGHLVDSREVRGVRARADSVGGLLVGADHMIGDTEHVESPLAVEVDQRIEVELAVAPG
jgi:hypothetical protein